MKNLHLLSLLLLSSVFVFSMEEGDVQMIRNMTDTVISKYIDAPTADELLEVATPFNLEMSWSLFGYITSPRPLSETTEVEDFWEAHPLLKSPCLKCILTSQVVGFVSIDSCNLI